MKRLIGVLLLVFITIGSFFSFSSYAYNYWGFFNRRNIIEELRTIDYFIGEGAFGVSNALSIQAKAIFSLSSLGSSGEKTDLTVEAFNRNSVISTLSALGSLGDLGTLLAEAQNAANISASLSLIGKGSTGESYISSIIGLGLGDFSLLGEGSSGDIGSLSPLIVNEPSFLAGYGALGGEGILDILASIAVPDFSAGALGSNGNLLALGGSGIANVTKIISGYGASGAKENLTILALTNVYPELTGLGSTGELGTLIPLSMHNPFSISEGSSGGSDLNLTTLATVVVEDLIQGSSSGGSIAALGGEGIVNKETLLSGYGSTGEKGTLAQLAQAITSIALNGLGATGSYEDITTTAKTFINFLLTGIGATGTVPSSLATLQNIEVLGNMEGALGGINNYLEVDGGEGSSFSEVLLDGYGSTGGKGNLTAQNGAFATLLSYGATGSKTNLTTTALNISSLTNQGATGEKGTLTATGYNSNFLYDSFTGTNGTVLTSHTADTGHSWTAISGFTAHTITGNRIHGASGLRKTLSSATSSGTNISVTFSIYVVSNVSSSESRVIARSDASGANYIYAGWAQGTGSTGAWTISTRVADSNYYVASGDLETLTVGQTYNAELEISGTTATLFVNDVQKATGSVAAVSSAGKIGVYSNNGESTTGYHIGNIGAYNHPTAVLLAGLGSTGDINTFTSVVGTSAGDSFSITDDFNRADANPPSGNWVEDAGTGWFITTNWLEDDTNSGVSVLRHTVALDNAYRQFAKIHVLNKVSTDQVGLRFRMTSTFTDAHYRLLCTNTTTTWQSHGGSTVQSGSLALASGNWLGLEVEGTGTDTVVKVWVWANDPGARSTWGTAGLTFTNNPATAANTGLYIGIGDYATYNYRVDDFAAGSSANAP